MTQFESTARGAEKKGGKSPTTTPSNPASPTTAQISTTSTSPSARLHKIAKGFNAPSRNSKDLVLLMYLRA